MALESLATGVFKDHKRDGWVSKIEGKKAFFADGRQYKERTLYYDCRTKEYIVMLNGNAQTFTPYDYYRQDFKHDDYIRGHI